jgi:hypothetical protein
MRRITEDGGGSACVAINVDECRSLDAIVALPADREGGISLFDVDRCGVPSGGPESLNRISASISGTSAGIRLPRGAAAW